MRLCIADPPYLGKAEMFYGATKKGAMNQGGNINPVYKADVHPEAHVWDDPATHKAMVERLMRDYDGWAVAMLPDSLFHYLKWVPRTTRIAVWHDPKVMPTGSHPRRRWEPVLIYRPPGRRKVSDVPHAVGDVLSEPHQHSFAGAKPAAWTRWVLDMLGYDQDNDTVDDLFHGSGAVIAEVNQRTFELEAR